MFQAGIHRTGIGMFVKIKVFTCKNVKHLLKNLKELMKENAGPKKALEMVVLL